MTIESAGKQGRRKLTKERQGGREGREGVVSQCLLSLKIDREPIGWKGREGGGRFTMTSFISTELLNSHLVMCFNRECNNTTNPPTTECG